MRYWMTALLCAAGMMLGAGELKLKTSGAVRVRDLVVLELAKPNRFCTVNYDLEEAYGPDKVLAFEYRVISKGKVEYVAVNFRTPSGASTYNGFAPSADWNRAILPFSQIRFAGKNKPALNADLIFSGAAIYARIANSNPPAVMTLELKNVQIYNSIKDVPVLPFVMKPCYLDFRAKEVTVTEKNGVYTAAPVKPGAGYEFKALHPILYKPALELTFEYRNLPSGSETGTNIAGFVSGSSGWSTCRFPFSKTWSRAHIPFSTAKFRGRTPANGEILKGLCFAGSGVPMELRKIEIKPDPEYNPLRGLRTSYSAYPLFDWKPVPGISKYLLEYNGETVEVQGGFYVPETPLKPGVVRYKVTALPSGRTVREDMLVVPERNLTWKLPAYDFAAYAKRKHPRMTELAAYWNPDVKLAETAAKNAAKMPIVPNPEPYKEGADPKIRAWIEWYGRIAGGVIGNTGRRLQALGMGAIRSGSPELQKLARDRALEAAKWDPESGSNMKRCDLACATLLRGLCWCYDAAYPILTPAERKTLADIIRVRGNQFWFDTFPFRSNEAQNHPWDRAEAAAFAALALAEEPEMEARYRYITSLYAYRFFPSLGFDGENNEGLEYWSYGLGLAVRFVDAARYTVKLNYFSQPWLRQTARFPMYCDPVGGYAISFSDNGKPNHSRIGPLDRVFTGKLAAAGQDPSALWYAGYPEKDGTRAQMPVGIPQSKFYPHIGWAVFNTFLPDGRENAAVGFHSGKYFAGHQHADQNSFVINAYGDKLAIDGGYYDWYGSPHFKAYSVHTQAHNTVMVDGKGQDWRKDGSDGKVTAFFDSPNFGFVAGDAAQVYQRRISQFDRDLLFVKPDYVFVFDRLTAPKESTFSWLLHSHTDRPIALNGRDFSIRRPLAELYGTMLLPANAKGKVAPAYTVMPVNGYSVDPVPNRQKEWCLTLEPAAKAKHAEFLSAMRIAKPGEVKTAPAWKVTDAGSAVLITGNNVEVLFNRVPGKSVKLGRFETDARCAAVILENGRAADIMKIGGDTLRYAGMKYGSRGDFALADKPQIKSEKCDLLRVNGKTVPAKLHTVTHPFGRKVYALEAVFELDKTGYAGITGSTAGHFIAGHASTVQQGEIAADKVRPVLLCTGKNLFTLTSSRPLKQVNIAGGPGEIIQARIMPVKWQPEPGALIVEAENITRENTPLGQVQNRQYASAGKANISWGAPGKYGEWEFTVQKAGEYRFYMRYAVQLSGSFRELQLDGKMLNPGIAGLKLRSTGGFGYTPDEWRYAALPKPVKLTAGKHVLRVTVLGGEGNLDCFAFVPENAGRK